MAMANGCQFPDDLLYAIDETKNVFVWLRDNGDGTFTVGMVSVAAAVAGRLVSYTPKKVGSVIGQFKSLAVIESSKWVGPVPTPLTGAVIETNDELRKTPYLANDDSYGRGWISRIKPTNFDAERGTLHSAEEAAKAMKEYIDKKKIVCPTP
jgi:glycine cleavage system H protein